MTAPADDLADWLRDKARAAYNDFPLYDRIYRQMLQDAVDEVEVIGKGEQHRAEVEALREYQKTLDDTGRLAPALSVRNQGTNSLHDFQ